MGFLDALTFDQHMLFLSECFNGFPLAWYSTLTWAGSLVTCYNRSFQHIHQYAKEHIRCCTFENHISNWYDVILYVFMMNFTTFLATTMLIMPLTLWCYFRCRLSCLRILKWCPKHNISNLCVNGQAQPWVLAHMGHLCTQQQNGYLGYGQDCHLGCLTNAYNSSSAMLPGSGDGAGMYKPRQEIKSSGHV